MLVAETLATEMKSFITEANKMEQKDAAVAIDQYCKALETAIYNAIKSVTITIPPGGIAVTGTSAAQSNLQPIVLEGTIS